MGLKLDHDLEYFPILFLLLSNELVSRPISCATVSQSLSPATETRR